MRSVRATTIAAAALMLSSCGEPSGPDMAAEKAAEDDRLATIINLSGNLCAKVMYVSPAISSGPDQGQFEVICNEYRNAEKAPTKKNMAAYMLDPSTNAVRFMGRDR